MNEGMENLKQIEELEERLMKTYTLDEITGAWYEAYGEYLQDDYAGFVKILKKIKGEK